MKKRSGKGYVTFCLTVCCFILGDKMAISSSAY